MLVHTYTHHIEYMKKLVYFCTCIPDDTTRAISFLLYFYNVVLVFLYTFGDGCRSVSWLNCSAKCIGAYTQVFGNCLREWHFEVIYSSKTGKISQIPLKLYINCLQCWDRIHYDFINWHFFLFFFTFFLISVSSLVSLSFLYDYFSLCSYNICFL